MLEIRDLVKVYKTKGGEDVRAIDGVSLQFGEKGMVFLLGKSGSGKSTLLNLCGGLDMPDEGEIIIKGRSSKDFTQADFDSYRNTFIGFIFQEYNVLDEFSVEDNIALALELQGKNKNREQVLAILRQVEMEAFASRKPNTLSGGQKQRVAIARALVKNPEIIMADEPTGALDSNTGRQVLETLKSLSENKLVIVVSHDREFAETYGDRIIELKDGKVISDEVKTRIPPGRASGNVRVLAGGMLSVRCGDALTDEDLCAIRRFLSEHSSEALIAADAETVGGLKKAARIDEEGVRETFVAAERTPVRKNYAPEDSVFIRSRLPVRHAIRIGASGMRVKPVRLVFTVLLAFIAFSMFGLFSTLAFYNQKDVVYATYRDEGYDMVDIRKFYYSDHWNSDVESFSRECPYVLFTEEERQNFSAEYDGALGIFDYQNAGLNNWRDSPSGIGTYRAWETYNPMPLYSFRISDCSPQQEYYYTEIQAFGVVDPASEYWNSKLLTKTTDLSALGDDGIVISSFLFDSLKGMRLYDEYGNMTPLTSMNQIVGKTLRVLSPQEDKFAELVVKGVYDYSPPEEWFEPLTSGLVNAREKENALGEFEQKIFNNYYCLALVSDSFYWANYPWFNMYSDSHLYEMETSGSSNNAYTLRASYGAEDPFPTFEEMELSTEIVGCAPMHDALQEIAPDIYYFGEEKTALADGEVILSFRVIFGRWLLNYADYKYPYAEPTTPEYLEYRNATNILGSGWYTTYDVTHSTSEGATSMRLFATQADVEWALGFFLDAVEECADDPAIALPRQVTNGNKTYTVVGFIYGPRQPDVGGDSAYFSVNDFEDVYMQRNPHFESYTYVPYLYETKYEEPDNAMYTCLLVPAEQSSVLRSVVDGERVISETDDTYYRLVSPITRQLDNIDHTLDKLELIFLFVGLAMALFSMLLLFNFISVSITNKKNEIGILRAVGARGSDVFKIFFSESAIIAGICLVLSMVATFITCSVLNDLYAASIGASIFVFGPLSWLIMAAIAFGTSFLATFFPVRAIARKRPVDSIRAL